jgi:hypothetical protein
MAPMVGSLRGGALLMAAVLLSACSRMVVGSSQPVEAAAEKPAVPVAQLLIEPNRFPPPYSAAVLDDAGVDRAVQEVNGVPTGAVVTPATCTPPVLSHSDVVGAEGVDAATASRLIVVLSRPVPPLSDRLAQLRGCATFDVGGSAVTVTEFPPPPVDADASYAVEQTVTTADSERTSLTFAAQIGDTRVSVTSLQDSASDEADTASLDALFRDAVLKLRREG